MISIPKPKKEPSFRDAVRDIVKDEYKGYGEILRRLEADVADLRKKLEALKDAGAAHPDLGKVGSLEAKVKSTVSEIRQNFSKTISGQEERIAENRRSIKALESRIEGFDSGKGSGRTGKLPPKALEDVKSDLQTLEKNVFEQFDQMHKTVNELTSALDTKSREFNSMMTRLNKFQDEARVLSSENFIRDFSAVKLRLDRLEKAVTELKAREPVVLE